jgi:hypothetical protein
MPELLYHGSTVIVDKIDLSFGSPHKDFGKGFYTTHGKEQAHKFSVIKSKRQGIKQGFVSVYEYIPNPSLSIKTFVNADTDWLNFVLQNRGHISQLNEADSKQYDIIIGPVANDAVGLVLNQLLIGTYGDPASSEAKHTAIRLLDTKRLYNQVFFGTLQGVACLQFKEALAIAVD